MNSVAQVILAAGSGSRFGHSTNKVWLPLNGIHVIVRSIRNASRPFPAARIVLMISQEDEVFAREIVASELPDLKVELVHGGRSRHESETKALEHLSADIESGLISVVSIHDGARPLASSDLFLDIARAAEEFGGAIPAIPVDPREIDTVMEEPVVRVQTPQAYQAKPLLEAYRLARSQGFEGTDTAACMERYFPDLPTKAVPGEVANLKITYGHDFAIAERLLALAR